MKINELNEINRIGAYPSYQKNQQPQTAKSGAKSGKQDEVQISAEAKEMFKASQEKEKSRADRIQELKAQIAAGTYRVHSEKIAAKLLEFWRK
ncbi:hypothetical protein BSNK01_30370 [Bacillaceae bacterium]